jgi:AcrR family transcriptional regulator
MNGEERRKKLLLTLAVMIRERDQAVPGSSPARITVKSVARRAGVSHTLLYVSYPDLVEKIKRLANTGAEAIRKSAQLFDSRSRIHKELLRDLTRVGLLHYELQRHHRILMGKMADPSQAILQPETVDFHPGEPNINDRSGAHFVPANRELRTKLKRLNEENASLASINATLMLRVLPDQKVINF